MRRAAAVWGMVAFLACLPTFARAQTEDPPSGSGRLQRTQENLIAFKLLRMTQVLELTEEQTTKIYPVLTRMEKEKFEISKRLNDRMRSLRSLLQAEKPDEAKIRAASEDIRALRVEVRDKDLDVDQFLKDQLTVMQYARYTLFLVDFYRNLGEKLERARGMRRAVPPAKRPRNDEGPDRSL